MTKFLIIFLGLIFSTVLQASNLNFLKDAPIADFNKDDITMMDQNIYKSLQELDDGEKSAWKNDATGHSGLANPVKTYEKDGQTCRTIRIVNRSNKRIAQGHYDFCRIDDARWVLTSTIKQD